jgi:hypothetical protein
MSLDRTPYKAGVMSKQNQKNLPTPIQRLRPALTRWIQTLNATTIIAGMILGPVSEALQIKLNSDLTIRNPIPKSNEDSQTSKQLQREGVLRAGSIVSIPDSFTVKETNGTINLEATLNNWLRKAGRLSDKQDSTNSNPGLFQFKSKNDNNFRHDYFFPVKIVRAAPGSILGTSTSKTHYMAIKFLARSGGALVVTQDAPLLPAAPPVLASASPPALAMATPAAPTSNAVIKPQNATLQSTPTCLSGACSNTALSGPSEVSSAIHGLLQNLAPAIHGADQALKHLDARTQGHLAKQNTNFTNSCGFDRSKFLPVISREAQKAGIPNEILVDFMNHESSSDCFAKRNETNGTRSVGLFGINNGKGGARFPLCSIEEKSRLKSMGEASLSSGPRCLENPMINLSEAIRILKAKQAVLAKSFNTSQMTKDDLWRITISAYNGGETWVLRAKEDLEKFNQRWNTHLRAENWEDLRIFYLRQHLDRYNGLQSQYFGDRQSGRKEVLAQRNLAYTETIVRR